MTREEMEAAMAAVIRREMSAMPPEVVELEILKRKEALTPGEVEKLYGLNANTLNKRRTNREGPAYSKDGDKVLYTHPAVKKYLESGRQKTIDQP
jgi:hypothetical protein